MDFKMDEQSYRDLSIFSNTEHQSSVFNLFKKTKTVGGRTLIAHWMKNPSNAIDHLHHRTAAIEFFRKSNTEVKIDHDQFDLILYYLNYDRGQLKSNAIDSFFPWLRNSFKSDQNYYIVQVGVKYLLNLIMYADELATLLISSNASTLLLELATKIKTVLEILTIRFASSLSLQKKLNFYQLGKLDSLFRKDNKLLILDFLHLFYELDALSTLAKVANDREFCLPTYLADDDINLGIQGLFHPSLAAPVKTDIYIDKRNNLTFLSGSNMAGKSSLLKSVGLVIYLAHIGFPVPATSVRTTVFNGLITTINLADAIENGLSHYYSEVMRVKKIASLLVERKKMFVILDELFKGTNAKDAFDASLLVINGFSMIPDSIFIISSHITELAPKLNAKNVSHKYMEHILVDEHPKFTYQLKSGVAKDGIGMYFIEKEGIFELLERAKK